MSFFKKLFGRKEKKVVENETQSNQPPESIEEVGKIEQNSVDENAIEEESTKQDAEGEEEPSTLEEVKLELNQEVEVAKAELAQEVEEAKVELSQEIEEAKAELIQEVEEAKAELSQEIEEAKTELTQEVEEVRVELGQAIEETKEEVSEEIENAEVGLSQGTEESNLEFNQEGEEATYNLLQEAEVTETEQSIVVEEVEVVEEVAPKPKKKGFFSKLVAGLEKTRNHFVETVDEVLKNFKKIDEELYEELEEVLIMADFGVDTTLAIIEALRKKVKEEKITEPEDLKQGLQDIIKGILTAQVDTPILKEGQPNVVLVIGVNGVGKTTTIGKLSHQLRESNKKVVLAAADTFRAAAIEQLQIWADRAQVDLIKQTEGSDPASVVYDGIQAAKARKADVLICDTAGRLQNKTNLMKELEKIGRIIDREYPEAHKEVLIVLDATTGQNAISQVKAFKETAKVDGIVLTKLDGTAKGGAIVGICQSMQVPVKYIGVGEQIDDLQPFDARAFAAALFEESKK